MSMLKCTFHDMCLSESALRLAVSTIPPPWCRIAGNRRGIVVAAPHSLYSRPVAYTYIRRPGISSRRVQKRAARHIYDSQSWTSREPAWQLDLYTTSLTDIPSIVQLTGTRIASVYRRNNTLVDQVVRIGLLVIIEVVSTAFTPCIYVLYTYIPGE